MIDEKKCEGCPFSAVWSKGGEGGYPACSHPGSGPRALNLLDEMDKCPEKD